MLERIVVKNPRATKTFLSPGKWFLLEERRADMTKDDQTQNLKFSKCKAKNFGLPW